MADRWTITLGARYTYDNKGMVYQTASNSVGVPDALVIPDCTPTSIKDDGNLGCDDFVDTNSATKTNTMYTMKQKIGQAAVVAGALNESPALLQAPQIDANCTVFDNVGNSTTNPDGLSKEKFIGTPGLVAPNRCCWPICL